MISQVHITDSTLSSLEQEEASMYKPIMVDDMTDEVRNISWISFQIISGYP